MLVTICPRSLDPFDIVSYYIYWVKTSWTLQYSDPLHKKMDTLFYSMVYLGPRIFTMGGAIQLAAVNTM